MTKAPTRCCSGAIGVPSEISGNAVFILASSRFCRFEDLRLVEWKRRAKPVFIQETAEIVVQTELKPKLRSVQSVSISIFAFQTAIPSCAQYRRASIPRICSCSSLSFWWSSSDRCLLALRKWTLRQHTPRIIRKICFISAYALHEIKTYCNVTKKYEEVATRIQGKWWYFTVHLVCYHKKLDNPDIKRDRDY